MELFKTLLQLRLHAGNVLDLAVAVVMGAAFGAVVTALVAELTLRISNDPVGTRTAAQGVLGLGLRTKKANHEVLSHAALMKERIAVLVAAAQRAVILLAHADHARRGAVKHPAVRLRAQSLVPALKARDRLQEIDTQQPITPLLRELLGL